jgi:tetratricopeptide (TPR) repeat protein
MLIEKISPLAHNSSRMSNETDAGVGNGQEVRVGGGAKVGRVRLPAARRWKVIAIAVGVCVLLLSSLAFGVVRWQRRSNDKKIKQAAAVADARELSMAGSCAQAASDLKKILDSGTGDIAQSAEAYYLRGECLIQTGDNEAAVKDLEKAKAAYDQLKDPIKADRANTLLQRARNRIITKDQPKSEIPTGEAASAP